MARARNLSNKIAIGVGGLLVAWVAVDRPSILPIALGTTAACTILRRKINKAQISVNIEAKSNHDNKAKEVLAYELTKEVHGEEKANLAQSQAKAAFGGADSELLIKEVSDVATVVDAMVATGVAKSKGEARRLIEQGGVSVDDTKVTDANMAIPSNEFVLHKGKKVHLKVVVK